MPRITPDPDDIERLYRRGYPDRRIAERLGCEPEDIRAWRDPRGLESNWIRMTQECEADIEEGIRRKMTVAEIVEWADVSRSQVRRVAKRLGIGPRRVRNAKGLVLQMIAEGKSTREIVAAAKCTKQVVAHYRNKIKKMQEAQANQAPGAPEVQPKTQGNAHVVAT